MHTISKLKKLSNEYFNKLICDDLEALGFRIIEKKIEKRVYWFVAKNNRAVLARFHGNCISLCVIDNNDFKKGRFNLRAAVKVYHLNKTDETFETLTEEFSKHMAELYLILTNENLVKMGLLDGD